ncbi:MAG: hypothetical protein EBR28_08190, partial [Planctomycetia bacterium]|nr:hypothetical protein [Planctomycetia bacterium]
MSGTGSFANLVLGGVGIGVLSLDNTNSNLSVSGSITMAPGAGNAQIILGSPTASLTVGGGSGSIVLGGGAGNASIVTNGNFNGSINAAVINVNDLNMSQSGSSTLTVTAGQTYNVSNLVRANNASAVVTSAVLNINGGVFNSFGSGYRFNSNTGANNVSYLNLNSGTFAGVSVTRSNQGADAAFNWNNGTVANYTGGNLVIQSASSAWQLPVLLSGTGTNIFNAQSSGTITVQSTAFLGNKSGEQGRFTKSGAGTLILNGSNSYTGGTTLSSGTIQLGAAGALGPSGSLTFSGGVLQYTSSGTATDYSGRFANSGSAITIDSNSQAISFGSAIASTNTGGFRKIGSGTVTLSAANAYTGLTQAGAGSLTLGSVDALATSTLDLATGDSGTVAFGVVGTNTYNLGGLQGSRDLANAGNGLSIGANNTSTTYSGTLSGVGTVSKVGSGTLTLSAANSYTGLTTVSGGVLQYGIDNALSTGAVTIDSGATLDLSTYSDSVGTVTLTSGRIIGSGTLTSTANYALASGTVSAPLAGSVGLTKSGAGTVVLSAANAYTGLTTVSGGVLQLGANQTSGTSSVTVTSGTLDLNGYTMNLQSVPSQKGILLGAGAAGTRAFVSTGSGTMVIQSSAVIPWIQYDSTNNPLGAEVAGNLRILSGGGFTGFMAGDSTATDEDLTISAVISGSLSTVYSTAVGTVVFTGLNTYAADGYQLRAGTWVLGTNALLNQPGALGNNGVTSVSVGHATQQQNAALFLRDGVTTDRRMTIVTNTASPFGFTRTIGGTFTSGTATFSGGMSLNTNAGVTAASGGTVVIGNTIIDGNTNFQSSGTFSKIGGGTVVFTGTNTFSYPTLISQGILSISSSNNLQNTAGVSIADTARLRYTGATGLFGRNVTVTSGTGTIENTGGGTLTLAGTLNKNGTVLRLTGGQFNVTGLITGTTVGTSDLLVDGTSTVTLSSANTYNGPTFVNQASNLIVGINNAIPSNSVVTLGNATTT